MDENEPTTRKQVLHQFGKLMLGSAAAFVATRLAEHAYDRVMEKRSAKSEVE